MKKRIFYEKERDNGDKVSEVYSSRSGSKYHVIVNFKLGYCKLLNSQRRNVIKIFHSHNEKVLLRKARKFLFQFGVILDSSERPDKVEMGKEINKKSVDAHYKKKYDRHRPE